MFKLDGKKAFDVSGVYDLYAEQGWPTNRIKANSFTACRGVESSVGHILLSKGDIDSMDLGTPGETFSHTLTISDGKTTKAIEGLCIWHAETIIPTKKPTKDTIYQVQLADRRVMLHLNAVEDSWSGGDSDTVEDVLTDIWNNLATESGLGLLSFHADSDVDETIYKAYHFRGQSVYEAMKEVLNDWSHTLIAKENSNFEVQYKYPSANDQTTLLNTHKKALVWGSFDYLPHTPRLPRKLKTYFHAEDAEVEYTTATYESGKSTIADTELPVRAKGDAIIESSSPMDLGIGLIHRLAANSANTQTGTTSLYSIYEGVRDVWPSRNVEKVAFINRGNGLLTELNLFSPEKHPLPEIGNKIHKAEFIRFALTAELTRDDETFEVEILDYWKGVDPDPADNDDVTVYNPPVNNDAEGAYQYYGDSGDEGRAFYVPELDAYYCFDMECP